MGVLQATPERAAARSAETLRPGEVAWLALLPCALLTAALVALLGPPLGRAFLAPGPETFWPIAGAIPEPEERGRYLMSLVGPVALIALVMASTRRPVRVPRAIARRAVLVGQLLLVAFAALCIAAQHDVLLSADVVAAQIPVTEQAVYFTPATLLVALLLPVALLAAMRRPGLAARAASLARETHARRIAGAAAAVLFTAIWLTTAIVADSSLANTATGVAGHLLWSLPESFAILNGRTPLVDFHSQYGQLWPYVAAAAMAVFGASIGTFTTTMAACSGAALLAVYALLWRIVGSSPLTLALYLPVVATGFFMKLGPPEDRYGPANLVSLWPIRYGGPYLLAWLLARHIDGAAPRRAWALFLVAGLVLVNNVEFGGAALAATVVALLAAQPPRSWRAAGRLLLHGAAGLLGALALLSLLTLASAGSLPRLDLLVEFTRLYGIGGWAMLPLPPIGLYLVVYLTFAAALVLAAVRVARRERRVLLTAMLAWSGVFGLIAGGYYAGRSHPQVLIDMFSPWALSLALLAVAVVRALAARGWRRPTPAELAVLFGFALVVCSLPQTPAPWTQIARIQDRAPWALFKQEEASAFVAQRTRPGEKVAILMSLGHRIAYDTGRVNVSPYASIESMPTVEQLDVLVEALEREAASKVFLSTRFTQQEQVAALRDAGFDLAAHAREVDGADLMMLVRPAPPPRR